MTEGDAAREWLLRSRESLAEATMLADARHFVGAVNRIYYACFYAASALLLTQGHGSSKHSGVLALFDIHWVRPGHVPPTLGRFYHDIFERRLRGDYTIPAAFSREEVGAWLAEATEFVQKIENLLSASPA